MLDSVRAKGVRGYAERLGTVPRRFGLTASGTERRLQEYVRLTALFGVAPTFPVTAVVLSRNPQVIRNLAAKGVEFAIHGFVHNDHEGVPAPLQAESVLRAKKVFDDNGVPVVGFRAPYLRADHNTLCAVRSAGLSYDSSKAVVFPVLSDEITADSNGGYARALRYYTALRSEAVSVRPRLQDGLVRIPVALPDDEIMVDRLHLSSESQAEAWQAILKMTHQRGDLFTIQLHPERFPDCDVALRAVLDCAAALPGGVWRATLGEVAQWWLARAKTRLTVERPSPGRVVVRLTGDPDARLEVYPDRSSPRAGQSRSLEVEQVELMSDRDPVVGVPAEASDELVEFLGEEGFIVRRPGDPARCGAFVHDPAGLDEQELLRLVTAGPGPLVRVARWPAGHRGALVVSGDIDALTLGDFVRRQLETRPSAVRRA